MGSSQTSSSVRFSLDTYTDLHIPHTMNVQERQNYILSKWPFTKEGSNACMWEVPKVGKGECQELERSTCSSRPLPGELFHAPLPQVVCPQVALPSLCGPKLDEGSPCRVKDAQDSDADTQNDDPVAHYHSCRESREEIRASILGPQ